MFGQKLEGIFHPSPELQQEIRSEVTSDADYERRALKRDVGNISR
jgi:hypothetical protein